MINIFQNEKDLPLTDNPYTLNYCGVDLDIRDIPFNKNNAVWYKLKESGFDGDIRQYWESARLQNLSLLINNYLITKDLFIISSINDFLNKWFENNPADYGWNHISNLEIAIRFLSLYRLYFYLGDKIEIDLENVLYNYGSHLYYDLHRTNLCVPNNHSLGEAVSLLLASKLFENAEWEKYAKKTIKKRLSLITKDGESVEESSGYHLFVTQMLMIISSICDDFDDAILVRIANSINILKSISDKNGNIGKFGDCDDGLFFVIDSFNRNNIKALNSHFLIVGRKLENVSPIVQESSKYLSTKEKGDYKVALIGGYDINHAHVQSLSFLLWYKGKQVIFSPGSYHYNGPDEKIRLELASQKYSNSPHIENVNRDNLVTKFRHKKTIRSVSLTSGYDYVSGIIRIGRTIVTRTISIQDDGVLISDESNNKIIGYKICAEQNNNPLIIMLMDKDVLPNADVFSPSYGTITKTYYYDLKINNNSSKVFLKK
ncbi:MAG: heparinase II/III-family protein [Bacilli bacterium]|nr:heparinase II/III-family protein [Bacilli bacterium]